MIWAICKPVCSIRLLFVARGVASAAARQPVLDDFGNLSRSGKKKIQLRAAENRIPDDPDGYDKEEFDIKPRKNAYYYKWEISNHSRKGKDGLKRALELFREMKTEARLTPTLNQCSALLYACSRAGQTKKAFELYDEGLKYFKKPTPAMVNCLINACAESPFPDYGLKRLEWLRTHLKVNFNFEMAPIHYRCMIKAYGKLGRIDLAARVVQEMCDAGIQPTSDTFNMLMIGCASQKDSGTLLALRIYKRMRMYGIKPDSITYANFLRCISYCGMGSPEALRLTISELPALTSFEQRIAYKAYGKKVHPKEAFKEFEWLPSKFDLIPSIQTAIDIKKPPESGGAMRLIEDDKSPRNELLSYYNIEEAALTNTSLQSVELPNFLMDDHLTLLQRIQGIDFDKLSSKIARFQLFGGPEGFLDIMKRDGCEPNLKIFTLMCSLVEPDNSGLLPLYHLAREHKIKADEQYYNILIKTALNCPYNPRRRDLALCFLEDMQRDGLRPSVATFECLSVACDTMTQASGLIGDVERCGFAISNGLIEGLMKRALVRKDFEYINGMIKLCQKKLTSFSPSKKLLERLEDTMLVVNQLLVQHEKGRVSLDKGPPWATVGNLVKFDDFKVSLGHWLKSVEVLEEDHPWKQFDIRVESKRQGFVDYVREFQALERAKQEALDKGQQFGNLYAKTKTVNERQR